MKYLLFIFSVIILMLSCQHDNETYDEYITNVRLKKSPYHPNIELLPPSAFDEVIQYTTNLSRTFVHTIRCVRIGDSWFIKLYYNNYFEYDEKNSEIKNNLVTLVKEKQLSDIQVDKLKTLCNDLPQRLSRLPSGVDGFEHDLVFLLNGISRSYNWQNFKSNKDTAKDVEEKLPIMVLLGYMMELCDFPLGQKLIVKNDKQSSLDTTCFNVFWTNRSRVYDYQITLDGKPLNQNQDNLSLVKLATNDTFGINDRINFHLELLGGQQIKR